MDKLLLILFSILSAIISSYLTYYYTIKQKRVEAINKYKEERYKNLLIELQGFLGNTVSSEKKKRFFDEQYKSWLYSSDAVTKSLNNLIEHIIKYRNQDPPQDESRKMIGEIVLAMRKDLLGRTSLSWKDFRYTDVIQENHLSSNQSKQ